MTCIVGAAVNGSVFIGGDSCAASYDDYFLVKNTKVFRTGDFLIGYTSSFRMGQILEHHLSVRPIGEGEADQAYMVRGFIEAVRDCLKQYGYTKIENNQEEIGTFLVGFRGALYRAAGDLQILRPESGIAACGCGAAYALGAMAARPDYPPVARITMALHVAASFSLGVRGPFCIEELK